jgi:hypothetical protein
MRFLSVFLCAGCSVLFPEFDNKPTPADAASADADPMPHIGGVLCALGDLRDYRSCGPNNSTSMRVTVEETRDAATVDGNGHFTLPLSQVLDTAILAAADSTGTLTPTVTTVALSGGSLDGVAVPVLQAHVLQQVALQNGVVLDAKKGIVYGWATDGKGVPLAGIAALPPPGADGPFYDGPQASDVGPAAATSSHGLIVFFNVAPGDAHFTVGQKQLQLPVRGGALSLSLFVVGS